MKIQHSLKILLIATIALISVRCVTKTCLNPNYIIPYSPLDSAFDQGIDAIRAKDQITALVQNPSAQNFKTYLISLAPFSVPLFVMALVTFLIFIATIIQVICFNSCSKQCCGNQLTSTTYNVCCMRAMVFTFISVAFVVMCISIAALIVSSDLQKAYYYTSCNTQNIVSQTYNGNSGAQPNWSGTNNFQTSISVFSVNIQNNIPFLARYFNSTNTAFASITDTTAGSSYSNAINFACQKSSSSISCPFPSSGTCPSPYQAQFNQQFCNATFQGSAQNLINTQISQNSTTWFNNTQTIGIMLNNLTVTPTDIQSFSTQISQFSTSFATYESSIQSGFAQADTVQLNIQIAFYVFYGFILAISLLSIVTVCMVYCCYSYKCRYFMYFYWYMFFLLALLLFINSGFFMGASIFFQDSCLAYPYYFKNQNNFNQLNFQSSQVGGVFKTCFFGTGAAQKSIFSGFADTSVLTQFTTLYSLYQAALPSSQFSTVVTKIENTLTNYKANPNTVLIQNVAESVQPQTALNQFNTFANFNSPSSNQACKLTVDYFTFDVINCGTFLTNQAVGTSSCNVLFASNINTIISGRVTAFNNRGCAVQANTYQNSAQALISYGNSIATIVNSLAPIQQSTTPLQTYQNSYFNYYTNVANFYNSDVQQIFNGFFNPYNTIIAGSSCGYVTASMNGIVDIACNQLQPYLNIFSSLNVVQSIFVFILFILAYFLTTRLEFYEYLEGNFANYGAITVKTQNLGKDYQLNSNQSRNVQLLQVNRSL